MSKFKRFLTYNFHFFNIIDQNMAQIGVNQICEVSFI